MSPTPRMTRRLGSTVLTFEAMVVFFAALVASRLSDLSAATALGLGGGLALACVLSAGLLRARWGLWLASALQVVVIATGFVVTTMFVLGVVFAALWVAALRIGAMIEAGPAPGPPAT